MKRFDIASRLNPSLIRIWLHSREAVKDLRFALKRLRFAAHTSPKMQPKVMKLMRDIALEEEQARRAIAAIHKFERLHRKRRFLKKLRRLCAQPMPRRRRDREERITTMMAIAVGLSLPQPVYRRPQPANP